MNLFDLYATLKLDSSKFTQGVKDAQAKTNNLAQGILKLGNNFSNTLNTSLGASLKNVGRAISNFGNKVSSVGRATSVVTAGVGALLGSAFSKAKSYIGTYESAMATFRHSAQIGQQGAQALYDSLLGVAKNSAYAREHFLSAGQSLVAMGLSADDTTKYIQAITDVTAKMGGTGQNIEEMADLFGKLSMQTNLYTMDIQQMVTAGIPAWDILAAHYGTTTDAVKDMASKGLIPAKESLDLITDALEETNSASEMFKFSAAGMAKELKEGTLTGTLDALNTSFREFSLTLLGLDPQTDQGVENIKNLNKAISTFGETLKDIAKKFSFVGDWIQIGISNITKFLEMFKEKLDAMPQERLEQIARIVGIIAAAGPALMIAGKAITLFGNSFQVVGTILQSVEGVFSTFGVGLGDIMGKFQVFGSTIGGSISSLGSIIGEKMGGIKGSIFQGISEIFGNVTAMAPQMMSAFMGMFNMAAIGGAIFAGLGLIQQNFGDKITEFSNFLIEKGPEMITNFANSILNSLPILIEQGGQLVATLINTINANLPAIMNAGMSILSTLVTGFAQQLPSLIPLAVQTILTLVEGIANNIDQILNAGVELINGIVTGLTNALPMLTEKAPEIINNVVNGIVNAMPALMDAAGRMIETILKVITANLPAILGGGIKILMSLVKGIAKQLPALIPAAIDAVLTFVETLIDNIDEFVDAGIELIIGLAEGLIKAIPKIIDKIPIIIEKLLNAIVRNTPKLLNAGIKLIVELGVGLVKAIPQLVSKIPQIIWAIVDAIKGQIWNLFNVGKELVEGLWNGINDMVGWIGQKIREFGENIVNGLKSFFGIASPSKLMRDKVGKYLAEGIAEGFSNEIGNVERSMVDDMRELSSAMQLDDISYNVSTMGKSSSNMVNALLSVLKDNQQEINVYIGGKRIANEIYDPLMDIMKSKEVYVGA